MDIKIYSPSKVQKRESSQNRLPMLSSEDQSIPQEYKDVAKGMEQQFAEFMIKQMEKTTGREKLSVAENYYTSLLGSERAKILAEVNGGLGLQDMILDRIYPEELRIKKASQQYNRQQAMLKG